MKEYYCDEKLEEKRINSDFVVGLITMGFVGVFGYFVGTSVQRKRTSKTLALVCLKDPSLSEHLYRACAI